MKYIEEIKSLITKLKKDKNILLFDHRDDVVKMMENASALIVASPFEGLGRMTIEASFKGCLVLGRNSGGTREILNITKGGLVFNTKEELSFKMLEISKMIGTEEYTARALFAQNICVEKCSNENYCEMIFGIYLNLINRIIS